ncbi:hypothetical protein [Halovivax gelatinilyticus]|uniref:hypothetical protein n=1 Tax=Halovivax gelatinilyticus TaxID=2961597 RepID=UPI0020CA5725|nr:hypothetical protein [Halovivax gelatinilyticus]
MRPNNENGGRIVGLLLVIFLVAVGTLLLPIAVTAILVSMLPIVHPGGIVVFVVTSILAFSAILVILYIGIWDQLSGTGVEGPLLAGMLALYLAWGIILGGLAATELWYLAILDIATATLDSPLWMAVLVLFALWVGIFGRAVIQFVGEEAATDATIISLVDSPRERVAVAIGAALLSGFALGLFVFAAADSLGPQVETVVSIPAWLQILVILVLAIVVFWLGTTLARATARLLESPERDGDDGSRTDDSWVTFSVFRWGDGTVRLTSDALPSGPRSETADPPDESPPTRLTGPPGSGAGWPSLVVGGGIGIAFIAGSIRLFEAVGPTTVGQWMVLLLAIGALAAVLSWLYGVLDRQRLRVVSRRRLRDHVAIGFVVAAFAVGSVWLLQPVVAGWVGPVDDTVLITGALVLSGIGLVAILLHPRSRFSTSRTEADKQSYRNTSGAYRQWLAHQQRWFDEASGSTDPVVNEAARKGIASIETAVEYLNEAEHRIDAGDPAGFYVQFYHARRYKANIFYYKDRVRERSSRKAINGDGTNATRSDGRNQTESEGDPAQRRGEPAVEKRYQPESDLESFARELEIDVQQLPSHVRKEAESFSEIARGRYESSASIENVRRVQGIIQSYELSELEQQRNTEKQLRFWIVSIGVIGFVPGVAAILGFDILPEVFDEPGFAPSTLLAVIIAGSLGAAVSSLQNWRNIAEPIDQTEVSAVPQLTPATILLPELAFSRILIGAIGALTFYFALLSDLVVPIDAGTIEIPLLLLVSFAAGFLERLFPSTLEKLLDSTSTKDSEKSATGEKNN